MWSARTQFSNPKDRLKRKPVTKTRGNYCYSSRSPAKNFRTPKKNRQFNQQLQIYEKVKRAKQLHPTKYSEYKRRSQSPR